MIGLFKADSNSVIKKILMLAQAPQSQEAKADNLTHPVISNDVGYGTMCAYLQLTLHASQLFLSFSGPYLDGEGGMPGTSKDIILLLFSFIYSL